MASEQPVKKKLRTGEEVAATDEPDFIHNLAENGTHTGLSVFRSANQSEEDITLNALNIQLQDITKQPPKEETSIDILNGSSTSNVHANGLFTNHNRSLQQDSRFSQIVTYNSCETKTNVADNCDQWTGETDFQFFVVKQCLCSASDNLLVTSLETDQNLDCSGTQHPLVLREWPLPKLMEYLSKLQLLFDLYLKQNTKGLICSRLAGICDAIVHNEHNLIEQIILLCETRNKYVCYLAARVLSSFFVIAKVNINNEWLETIVKSLMDDTDFMKMNFALEVMKRVVEWKDVDIHVLEDTQVSDGSGPSSSNIEVDINCTTIPYIDPESFDTSPIKGLIIRSLEAKWPILINKLQQLILHNTSVESQTCILTLLALWESIISVKANLSVIDTRPFYSHLDVFVSLLTSTLPPLIWKQLLSLFNEVLCYGSTLALQDMLPEDTCQLAHLIVRYVKDFRILDSLPFRCDSGYTVNSFAGTIPALQPEQSVIDKTLLQKMVLLVLKSVAVTIKETRSDSSDSSVGSDDYDYYQDMQLIERSIRDVLKKVDVFVKNSLEFHPETLFSKVLVHLFSDQDDYMIEAMVCTLDITIGISYRNAVFPDLISMLNPIHTFIEFLKVVHDENVLLDYLVSNETCFLLYLLRFLKYVRRNWSKFVASCNECSSSRVNYLDKTMRVLIELKIKINRLVSKQLFPYNIEPVVRLLDTCENLYDGYDYS